MDNGLGIIVDKAVSEDKSPILYGERSDPVDKYDSGWQFTSGDDNLDLESAKIWSVEDVLEYDRSLLDIIDLPIETVVSRISASAAWSIKKR